MPSADRRLIDLSMSGEQMQISIVLPRNDFVASLVVGDTASTDMESGAHIVTVCLVFVAVRVPVLSP